MTIKEKTHYRKAFNSPYLSSGDIVGPTILTVAKCELSLDKTKRTRDSFNTITFKEKEIRQGELLKPMILNATNSRTMKDLTGSAFIDDWAGVPITVYVDDNVRMMGETVEGLRISKEKPRIEKAELLPNTPNWKNAIVACKRDGNLDAVKKVLTVSAENENALIKEVEDVD
jgi:hypothetical protein